MKSRGINGRTVVQSHFVYTWLVNGAEQGTNIMLSFAVLVLDPNRREYIISDIFQSTPRCPNSRSFRHAYSTLRYYRKHKYESVMEIYQYDSRHNITSKRFFNPSWSIGHAFGQLDPQ